MYAIGFVPGFPYLGYLPAELCGVGRLPSPRLRVEPGSVGLTGRQTGVYPLPRPAGWNILGRTPLTLVDVADGYFPIRVGRHGAVHADRRTRISPAGRGCDSRKLPFRLYHLVHPAGFPFTRPLPMCRSAIVVLLAALLGTLTGAARQAAAQQKGQPPVPPPQYPTLTTPANLGLTVGTARRTDPHRHEPDRCRRRLDERPGRHVHHPAGPEGCGQAHGEGRGEGVGRGWRLSNACGDEVRRLERPTVLPRRTASRRGEGRECKTGVGPVGAGPVRRHRYGGR